MLQELRRFVQECAKRGLLVMLDMHRLAAAGGIPDLWYDKEYPETAVLTAWRTIVLRYSWSTCGCYVVICASRSACFAAAAGTSLRPGKVNLQTLHLYVCTGGWQCSTGSPVIVGPSQSH